MTGPRPDRVDETSVESFPASDPPGWEPLHSGPPIERREAAAAVPVQHAGSISEAYERWLGPLLFEPYAADCARRLDLAPGAEVLELACGTGRVTRRLRRHLAPEGHVTATDINATMLAVAQACAEPGADVDWRQADALKLPFADASFDAIVCQFGFMFFPDKHAAAREALRVLRPGGELLLSVCDSPDDNPLAKLADSTVASFYATNPPEFLQIPYGYYDAGALDALLADGGFVDVVVETLSLAVECESARQPAKGYLRGTPLFTEITNRGTVDIDTIEDALTAVYAKEFGDHPLRAPMRAKIVSGRRPAAAFPVPLD